MTEKDIIEKLKIGENIAVEFKRGGNGFEEDSYQTVCSFLNRFGGDLFLGVLDDGTVVGVNQKSALDMVKNFISNISNPDVFSPTIYLTPEIKVIENKTVIHVHIPVGSDVFKYKNSIYDRIDDADVKVTASSQIASMYIRKQNTYTERKIYPYVSRSDLRDDLINEARIRAKNHSGGTHPWDKMSDEQILKSAGLYSIDRVTGESGFNLAAVLLLGRDDVILDVAPAYVTDAILKKKQVDRYDDREIIKTNLINSYDELMSFARKHLPDKFYLDDDVNISLRNIIARELIANTLIHREFSSDFTAKFVIENHRIYTENASRASGVGMITPENAEPNPKNPLIASFFRVIGLADQLGSGVRNLFKYSKLYTGNNPVINDGDVFRAEIEYDNLETDYSKGTTQSTQSATQSTQSETEKKIIAVLRENPHASAKQISEIISESKDNVKYYLSKLKDKKIIRHEGNNRSGKWIIIE